MIEKWIKNDQSLKRWRRFKRKKSAVISCWILLAICFFSFSAEIWVNNKPMVLSYQQKLYFPVLKQYHPSLFGREDIFVMDYRELKLAKGDWAIWPVIAWDPYESNTQVTDYPAPPSTTNLLGTDDRGRDVFARLIYGFRYSITFAVLVWFLSFFIGIILGSLMGYMGGWVDLAGQRVLEIWESMPQFAILLLLISIFSPNMLLFVSFMSLFGWMMISVYTRAEFLRLRKQEFVEAAKSLGLSKARIIFKHVLPNALGPVLTFSPFVISGNIAGLAALDYLGFGLKAPTPSWGELLAQAGKNFTIAWWLAVYTSLALFITLLLLNLIGDAVREACDPRAT